MKILSLPPMKGNNLIVLSRSGGIAIVAADSAERYGFKLFPLAKSFTGRIQSYFRAKVIQPTNPLDLGDLFDFDLYTKILDQALRIKGVDGILFQHGSAGEEKEPSRRLIHAVKELSFRHRKPVALCYFTEEEELAFIKRTFDYPIFTEPSEALSALAVSREYYRKQNVLKEKPIAYRVDRGRVKSLIQTAQGEKRDLLLPEAYEVLRAYGIPVADYQIVCQKEDLRKVMNKIGVPVALKIVSPEISHKSDVGGVVLNISRESEAEEAYDKMKRLVKGPSSGVLVQKMVSDGKGGHLRGETRPFFWSGASFWIGRNLCRGLQGDFSPRGSD